MSKLTTRPSRREEKMTRISTLARQRLATLRRVIESPKRFPRDHDPIREAYVAGYEAGRNAATRAGDPAYAPIPAGASYQLWRNRE